MFLIEMKCMGQPRFPIPDKDIDMMYIPYDHLPDKYVLLRSNIFNTNVYNSTRAGVVEFYYSRKDEHWKEFLYIWEIFSKSINSEYTQFFDIFTLYYQYSICVHKYFILNEYFSLFRLAKHRSSRIDRLC